MAQRDWLTARITPATYEMAQALKVCCRRRDLPFELREDPQDPSWEISYDYKDLKIFYTALKAMENLGWDDRVIEALYLYMIQSATEVFGEEKVSENL